MERVEVTSYTTTLQHTLIKPLTATTEVQNVNTQYKKCKLHNFS